MENQNATRPRRRGFGPGAAGMAGKENIDKGTWGKLLHYCRQYWIFIVIALLCAAISTILTLAGPDKLSEMTDTITEGLAPDTDKLQEVLEAITGNLSSGTQMPQDLTIDGVRISIEDQQETLQILSEADQSDSSAMLDSLDKLPESVRGLVEPSIDMEKILQIAMTLLSFYVAGILLSALQSWIMATITQKVARKLREDISRKINRLPMSYYHQHSTGDVLSRVTNDVDTIGMSLNMSVGTLVSAVTLFLGSLIMMIKTNLLMTGTGVLATVLGFVLMIAIMKHSQKYFTRQQRHLGELNGHIEEMYSGHTVVKAYNGEKKAKEEFCRLNDMLKKSGFRAQSLSGLMMPIMTFIGNFGYVAVCVTGGALALNNQISFGVIISFMMYIRFYPASVPTGTGYTGITIRRRGSFPCL